MKAIYEADKAKAGVKDLRRLLGERIRL